MGYITYFNAKKMVKEALIKYMVIPGRINLLQLGSMANRVINDFVRTSRRILIG